MTLIHTWLVEADASYRRNLKTALELEERIAVERVFPSCTDFFDRLESESPPDVVLMDLELPLVNVVKAIRKLGRVAPNVAVVVLTVSDDRAEVLAALKAGAAGCLLKESDGPEISQGIQQVFLGGAALSPNVARTVVEELHQPLSAEEVNLSQREVEVLEKLADGLAVKEIATVLDISVATTGFHLTNIYKKLRVQSQTGAVARAIRSGIL